MKILFVSGGNESGGTSAIVLSQGKSLISSGLSIEYFAIIGKGLTGYLKAVFKLRKRLRTEKFDLVHAHYSLSGFVAALAGARPLVVSLMGSDVRWKGTDKYIIKLFNYFFWESCIVKTEEMKSIIGIKKVAVIPNGVDLNNFMHIPKHIAIKKIGFNPEKKHILFAANPDRYEKNFRLAESAFRMLDNKTIELHFLKNIAHDLMPYYYNASDVVLLTSLWEGSPNVIKEAMACNRPIVATDVGDIRDLLGSTMGCFISDFTVKDVSDKINLALAFTNSTEGRNKITHLDANVIASRIISIYKNCIIGKQD